MTEELVILRALPGLACSWDEGLEVKLAEKEEVRCNGKMDQKNVYCCWWREASKEAGER